MTFTEMEAKIQAELFRLLSIEKKVPHSDKAHPMFKATVERYGRELKQNART